jgi:flagellar biosynthesis/type III secretory pathway M-ring protein FliF/YscJ
MRLLSRVSVAAALAAAVLLAFWWSNLRPNVTSLVPADEPTIAQAIVQEYLGAMHNDGFSDPSLQLLARETQLQILRLEPTTP